MTSDQKDELLTKMAEALRGLASVVAQVNHKYFSEAYSFATQVLNAYDAAMKPELEPGWYVVQWQEDGDLECGEFSCGNWYGTGVYGRLSCHPHRIIRRIELEE